MGDCDVMGSQAAPVSSGTSGTVVVNRVCWMDLKWNALMEVEITVSCFISTHVAADCD